MTEYINRKELINNRPEARDPRQIGKEEYNKGWNDCRSAFYKCIEDEPADDVAPVRHGHWIHTDYAIHWTAKDECSECTYHTCDRDDLSEYNYCPNCGAKMDFRLK